LNFDTRYALELLLNRDFWQATWVVVELSLASWLLATVAGFGVALAKQSPRVWLHAPARAYIWFFRSLPLLVLLIFIYSLPQVFPALRESLANAFVAGLIALVMSETAYIAEIHRGGLLAIPRGQLEAGRALGVSFFGVQRLIVVPQAIRVALPALANELITITKLTSLVSVISLTEILMVGQRLYTQNFLVLETLAAVAFFYVLIVTVFERGLAWLEQRVDVTRRGRRAQTLTESQVAARLADARPLVDACPVGESQTAARSSDAVALEAIALKKSWGAHQVLGGVNLTVKNGEVISIIGRSGSGKTTFIRLLNGLETLDSGEVRLYGAPFIAATTNAAGQTVRREDSARIRDVGMVFQSFNLFGHKTVLENMLLAPRYHGMADRATLEHAAFHYLNKVGMAAHAQKYPHQLSGGQQQRVAIARALMMSPGVILFDEPTSALDPETVDEVLSVIRALADEGVTMIIVTHEMNFAFEVSDRILLMEAGQFVCDDTPANLKAGDHPQMKPFLKNLQS